MDSFIVKESTPIALPICTYTRAGYTFGGWITQSDSAEPVYTDGAEFTICDEDITLYALWIPGSGTKYTVEHYQQNLGNESFTVIIDDTQNLTGVTGQNAVYNSKNYSGFTYASELTQINETVKTSGLINADGSTVIKLYYTRNTVTITLDLDGGTGTESLSGKYGTTVSIIEEPTKTGHTFKGWNEEGGILPTTYPTDDITYTAIWSANNLAVDCEVPIDMGTLSCSVIDNIATFTATSGYASYYWYLDGIKQDGTMNVWTFDTTNLAAGLYEISVIMSNGDQYSYSSRYELELNK